MSDEVECSDTQKYELMNPSFKTRIDIPQWIQEAAWIGIANNGRILGKNLDADGSIGHLLAASGTMLVWFWQQDALEIQIVAPTSSH